MKDDKILTDFINTVIAGQHGELKSEFIIRIQREAKAALEAYNKSDEKNEGFNPLPISCLDKKRGRNDECKFPVGSCQLCQS